MLKRTSAVLVAALALSACDQTAGGWGYFDTVEPKIPVQEPVVLIPAPLEEPDDTAAFAEAVEEAIDDSGIVSEEIEVVETPIEDDIEVVADAEVEVVEGETDEIDETDIATDDGTLNLNITSQEQQKIARDKAAILLAQAREELVIIEPGEIPEIVADVNIALFARETTHGIGDKVYDRPFIKARFSAAECAKFDTPDDAQRYFLANGGPIEDPLNLDPDGDGFACSWSPERYRLLK